MFKVPEYQLSKEMKHLFKDLASKYSKIDDDFLALFEKRYILFIEDGTDLKGEISSSANRGGNPFDKSYIDVIKEGVVHANNASIQTGGADDYFMHAQKVPGASVMSFVSN